MANRKEYKYNLKGVGNDIQLGKNGNIITGDDDSVNITDRHGDLIVVRGGTPIDSSDLATKSYVDQNIGTGVYKRNFENNDWSPIGSRQSALTIHATDHLKGTDPNPKIFQYFEPDDDILEGYYPVEVPYTVDETTGDVRFIIKTTLIFSGLVRIYGS